MASYPFAELEQRWQQYWRENGTTKVSTDLSKPKYYVLDMFPYPSGTGLHIGHPEGYTATDIISRFYRMNGYNVLHPMGFDSFGLPTERQAMKENLPPQFITERNIATFTNQLNALGFDYDWSRSVTTSDAGYYKWTQWMFLLIYNSYFCTTDKKAKHIDTLEIPEHITEPLSIEEYKDKHRLAFTANIPVNWCEELGTVLANEEVDEWKEKGYTVERRPMRQWMIRITAYAERLLTGLEQLQWPTSTMEMQRHWIGKSEGASIRFAIVDSTETITVFTTRPDTLFGATYMVLAPEHPLVAKITTAEQNPHVVEYVLATSLKSDLERTDLNKDKRGVFTGAYAINPASGEQIPVWIADYVLAHYGTGAIMAVPGHDERDHEFATTNSLPIVAVVSTSRDKDINVEKSAFSEYGFAVNSNNSEISLNGLPTEEAKKAMISWLVASGIGEAQIQYRLRDWLFSRQRYWCEPIPILFFEDGTKRALELDELPLLLPHVDEYKPSGTGESPLATVPEWIHFTDNKTGKTARFETNTMPQWAGSCWYYLRYTDPNNSEKFCSPELQQYWLGTEGVDLYVGGSEHAVLHLLYARFWHKVLYDYGYVFSEEPFRRLFHQGLILAEDGKKMSKSLGNTVDPLDIISESGADALRLYEMFLGPLEASKPWNPRGIDGVSRFLNRVWRLVVNEDGTLSNALQDIEPTAEQYRVLHTTIKKVVEDVQELSFNTSVSQFMIFVNYFTAQEVRPLSAILQFIQCLAPFAPHIAEELWHKLGETTSVHLSKFPKYDESKLVQDSVEIIVQLNSKIRLKMFVDTSFDNQQQQEFVLNQPAVQELVGNDQPKKIISVSGKLVNIIL